MRHAAWFLLISVLWFLLVCDEPSSHVDRSKHSAPAMKGSMLLPSMAPASFLLPFHCDLRPLAASHLRHRASPNTSTRPYSFKTVMAKQTQDFDAVADYILSKIDIHVSGACGPGRAEPLECFYPVHQAYSDNLSKKHAPVADCMKNVVPGGVPRPIESVATGEGYGLVYDRDIITTWRLPTVLSAYEIFFWEKEFERALGRNTMFVVLEGFFDAYPEICKLFGPSK